MVRSALEDECTEDLAELLATGFKALAYRLRFDHGERRWTNSDLAKMTTAQLRSRAAVSMTVLGLLEGSLDGAHSAWAELLREHVEAIDAERDRRRKRAA